jgi:hypothetical protein
MANNRRYQQDNDIFNRREDNRRNENLRKGETPKNEENGYRPEERTLDIKLRVNQHNDIRY